jgi:phage I-like protein
MTTMRSDAAAVIFIHELPALALDESQADGQGLVIGPWVQVARVVTKWKSPAYGEVNITADDLRTMLRNFREFTPIAPTELPFDYDHLSDEPRQPGDGAAAGWVKDLELRADDTELWAKPAWTVPAARRLANKEYRFISPYFALNFLDKPSGKRIGPTLRAIALTNRPFLEGMDPIEAPVVLSDAIAERIATKSTDAPAAVHDGHHTKERIMPDFKKAAAKMADGKQTVTCPECGKDFELEDVPPIEEMKEQVAEAAKCDTALREIVGVDKQGDLVAAVRALKDKATAEPAEVRQLRESGEKTARELSEVKATLKKRDVEQALADAKRTGKIDEKLEKSFARKFAEDNLDGFKTWLESAPVIVDLTERGSGLEGAASLGEAQVKIDALVQAKMKADPKLSYRDAYQQVSAENVSLAEQASAAQRFAE